MSILAVFKINLKAGIRDLELETWNLKLETLFSVLLQIRRGIADRSLRRDGGP